jgi:hypothetical protein
VAKGSEKGEGGAEQSPKVAGEAAASEPEADNDEPLMGEIMEEGRRVREEDRRKTSV